VIATWATSQNWKKNIFLGPKFKPSFALFGCCILHPKIYRTWSCYCLWCWGWRCSLNLPHFRQKFPKSCMELCKNSWLPKVSSVVGYIRYDFFDWYVRGWGGSNFSGFIVVHNNQHYTMANIECAFWSIEHKCIRLIGKVSVSRVALVTKILEKEDESCLASSQEKTIIA